MSRPLTRAEERSLRMGQARGRLLLSLRNASVAEKLQAYKRLELQLLKDEALTASEQLELRRRIAEDAKSAFLGSATKLTVIWCLILAFMVRRRGG